MKKNKKNKGKKTIENKVTKKVKPFVKKQLSVPKITEYPSLQDKEKKQNIKNYIEIKTTKEPSQNQTYSYTVFSVKKEESKREEKEQKENKQNIEVNLFKRNIFPLNTDTFSSSKPLSEFVTVQKIHSFSLSLLILTLFYSWFLFISLQRVLICGIKMLNEPKNVFSKVV